MRVRRRAAAGAARTWMTSGAGHLTTGTETLQDHAAPRRVRQGRFRPGSCALSAPTSARRTPQNAPAASAANAPARARASRYRGALSTAGARCTARAGSRAHRRRAWRPGRQRRIPDMRDTHTSLPYVPIIGRSLRTQPARHPVGRPTARLVMRLATRRPPPAADALETQGASRRAPRRPDTCEARAAGVASAMRRIPGDGRASFRAGAYAIDSVVLGALGCRVARSLVLILALAAGRAGASAAHRGGRALVRAGLWRRWCPRSRRRRARKRPVHDSPQALARPAPAARPVRRLVVLAPRIAP